MSAGLCLNYTHKSIFLQAYCQTEKFIILAMFPQQNKKEANLEVIAGWPTVDF
jgi:hypothetical protein